MITVPECHRQPTYCGITAFCVASCFKTSLRARRDTVSLLLWAYSKAIISNYAGT